MKQPAGLLRLVPLERFAPVHEPKLCCDCHPHSLAAVELVLRVGCQCGKFCIGSAGCAGRIFRRLIQVPGGFQVTS